MTTPECTASPIYYINPCEVKSFDVIEGTREKQQAAVAFSWILIGVFFLLNITYTCLINPSNSGIFKNLIKYLKKLDVGDSGVETLRDENDTKFIVKRKKNAEGGVAVLIIVMAIAVLVGYVVTSQLDIPANVQTQRNYKLPEPTTLFSQNYLADRVKFNIDKLGQHITDLIVFNRETDLFTNNSVYIINGNYTCTGVSQNCRQEVSYNHDKFEHYSVDFWNMTNPIVTFCSTKPLPLNESFISFAIRTGILPQDKSNVNLPLVTFGERSLKYYATYSKTSPPAIKIGLTATTSTTKSFLEQFTSDTGIQKVRVDDVTNSDNFLATSGCDFPIIQFHLQTNQWQVVGIQYGGISTIVISVFGAIGTVFGTRSAMKTIIQWIAKSYQNSPKKRAALDTVAFLLQSIIGFAAFCGIIAIMIVWAVFQGTQVMTTSIEISMGIGAVVFLNAFICSIATTILFCRRRPCFCLNTIRNKIHEDRLLRATYKPLFDEEKDVEINKDA